MVQVAQATYKNTNTIPIGIPFEHVIPSSKNLMLCAYILLPIKPTSMCEPKFVLATDYWEIETPLLKSLASLQITGVGCVGCNIAPNKT